MPFDDPIHDGKTHPSLGILLPGVQPLEDGKDTALVFRRFGEFGKL
jgi:hypothetical protein